MLSQLGCVTLPAETIDAVYEGKTLTPEQQAQYDAHPSVAYELLSKIPRLEPIAWMIDHQDRSVPEAATSAQPDMRLGAKILRLTLAYEKLIQTGVPRAEAAHSIARQNRDFSPEFFEALVTLDPNAEEAGTRPCRIEQLSPGMIIQQEIRTYEGTLLVSKGQEVTLPLLSKLRIYRTRRTIADEVCISIPKTALAFVKGAS
jgi:hypothetical protein